MCPSVHLIASISKENQIPQNILTSQEKSNTPYKRRINKYNTLL